MDKEEIGIRLKAIRRAVDYERYTQGTHDNDYKIEISRDVLDKLMGMAMMPNHEEGVAPQIMGIPIEINYSNPDIIKLWKRVDI